MSRAIVNKQVLDELIRTQLTGHGECGGVRPLPVTWRQRANGGCNWTIPGWTGDSGAVTTCVERMRLFLQVLRQQFDIPEEA